MGRKCCFIQTEFIRGWMASCIESYLPLYSSNELGPAARKCRTEQCVFEIYKMVADTEKDKFRDFDICFESNTRLNNGPVVSGMKFFFWIFLKKIWKIISFLESSFFSSIIGFNSSRISFNCLRDSIIKVHESFSETRKWQAFGQII